MKRLLLISVVLLTGCATFNDAVDAYLMKYDNNEYKLNYRSGGRRDRGYNEYKDYCYIPINLLKKF
jgi:hypothetical protein